jgi:hypothetical protein
MGQKQPPPDWGSLAERKPEDFFIGADDEAAQTARVEPNRPNEPKLRDGPGPCLDRV